MVIAEQGHVLLAVPPVDSNGAAQTGVAFNMEGYAHATILLLQGVVNAGVTLTVDASVDNAGGSAEAIPFALYREETTDGDVLGAREAILAAGATLSTNNNTFYAIEIDGHELPAGKPFVRVLTTSPGAVAQLMSAVVILSKARYAHPESETVK